MNSETRLTRYEAYRKFIDFVGARQMAARRSDARRVVGVIIWCLIVPLIAYLSIVIAIKLGWVGIWFRRYLDLVFLAFPVVYSFYFLGLDFFRDIPLALKGGGMASSLKQSLLQAKWREETLTALQSELTLDREGWRSLLQALDFDLRQLRNRIQYLTALAGILFFVIFQGVEAIDGEGFFFRSIRAQNFLAFLDVVWNSLLQGVSFIIFLLLFYFSGSQIYQSLLRYRDCLEILIADRSTPETRHK